MHEGVDIDFVKPDPRTEGVIAASNVTLRPGDEIVTYVARNLEPYRGYHIFMRALPEILRRRPNANVLIVGDQGVSYGQALPKGQTYRQRYLDEVAKDLDMTRVHFLGQVPYETLMRIYQISSAHVYLTYPFVLSWSLLEAMAAGCVVVASRTAPVEEVIVEGENGFLVDFFNPSEIAERVDRVISQAGDLQKVRERARRTVVENFDLKRVCLPQQLELLGIKEEKKTAS